LTLHESSMAACLTTNYFAIEVGRIVINFGRFLTLILGISNCRIFLVFVE
jgi:hypothetical protein